MTATQHPTAAHAAAFEAAAALATIIGVLGNYSGISWHPARSRNIVAPSDAHRASDLVVTPAA